MIIIWSCIRIKMDVEITLTVQDALETENYQLAIYIILLY